MNEGKGKEGNYIEGSKGVERTEKNREEHVMSGQT